MKTELLSSQSRAFVAVVKAGSITKAAEVLGIGKSSISESLRHLEATIGARLLTRTTRRQALTTIGKQFYRRCQELHDISTIAIEEISEVLVEPSGPLRITAPHAAVAERIAPALAAVIGRYPGLRPELIITDERLDLIEHRIDVAISVGDLQDSDYKAQRVGAVREILCASPEFLDRSGLRCPSVTDLRRLEDAPYIAHMWQGNQIEHRLQSKKTGKKRSFRFSPLIRVNTVHAILALIHQGVGVGILPDIFIKERLQHGELEELLPEFEPRESTMYAMHPFGEMAPLSVRTIIEAMKRVA